MCKNILQNKTFVFISLFYKSMLHIGIINMARILRLLYPDTRF